MTPVKEIQEGQTLTNSKTLVPMLENRLNELHDEMTAINGMLSFYRSSTRRTRSASTTSTPRSRKRRARSTTRALRNTGAQAKWRQKILTYLSKNEEVRRSDFVTKAKGQKSSAIRAFHQLEKQGYLVADVRNRVIFYTLTPKGKKFVESS